MKKDRHLEDLSNLSMLELFQAETENQAAILTSGLLELERNPTASHHLEVLMRAAHSLKGAARIVNLGMAVKIAHALEDCFVAAQNGLVQLGQAEIDLLFQGIDLLLHISKCRESEINKWESDHETQINRFLSSLAGKVSGQASLTESAPQLALKNIAGDKHLDATLPTVSSKNETPSQALRVTADSLNRLLGLAGESLVESRWLHPFADSMRRLKRLQFDLTKSLEGLRDTLEPYQLSERAQDQMNEALGKVTECRQFLSDRMMDLEMFDRRSANLSHRLYQEVLQCRMRPFGDGVNRFPRMVRDLARSLSKEIKLEVTGEYTQVDREILERLEAPLAHLLRNAVDHGCEMPEERQRAGKPAEGTVHLEARHGGGMLLIIVSDDGPGVDPEKLREAIVQKRLIARSVAEKLSEMELLEFLLLPGFTMKETVTEISGRGVGLDVVQNVVKSLRGTVRMITRPGKGMRFQLQLPLTLSVLRALLLEVAGEPYAIPLAQIVRALKIPKSKINTLEGRNYFTLGDQQIGLVTAHQVLDRAEHALSGDQLSVVVLGDRTARYGLVVDNLLGERELVVQGLDPRLGKVKDISSGALMEDGSPVLILDVEDMVRSIEKLVATGDLDSVQRKAIDVETKRSKRILAIDDSLTVRELERKLLASHGYVTEVAVDGMDGWNAVRTGNYDLVITDVDMPRMDGIELATLIKKDPKLKSIPVMIVSYKDREEDRMRGLEAGADYYLTKGSFHNETLLQAVVDLIGEAES
ncbi:MAG: CheA signal transduction histidine kinase [Pedosphaera sp.]|nr:CheA signal transduction histidine kinase [Pedosphaera sp.]